MAKEVSIGYNKELNKYDDQILFPEKVALAKKQLKGVKLPSDHGSSKKDQLL